MSLQVWLPLNGNLNNQGLSDVTVTNINTVVNNNGKIGQCYSFDGGTARLKIPNPIANGINEFSLCCWFYMNSSSTQAAFFGARSAGNGKGILCFMNKTNSQILFDDGSRFTLSYTVSNIVAKWNHIAFIKTPTQKKIYLNGELIGSQNNTSVTSNIRDELTIGNDSYETYTGNGLNGYLNDARIYDHALSDKEVQEIAKGLILHYKLNEKYRGNKNLISNFDTSFLSYSIGATTLFTNQMNNGTQEIIANFEGAAKCLHLHSNGQSNRQYRTYSASSGKTYTISLDYYSLSIQTTPLHCELNGGDYSWTGANSINYTTPGVWQRMSATYNTLTSNATLYFFILCANGTDCYIKNIKIEEGTISTPYVPNENSNFYNGLGYNNTIIYDSSGYNNNGIVINSLITNNNTIKYDFSTQFNGSNTAIAVGRGPMVKDEISICCWAQMDNWSNYTGRLISCTEGGGWNFEPSSGKMCFTCGTGASSNVYKTTVSTTTLADLGNKWHFFVGTYNGLQTKIYIDGILETTNNAYSTKTPIYYHSSNGIFVGAEATSNATAPAGNYYFNGKMSDLRIYATALTEMQVKELYDTSVSIDKQGNIYTRELIEE